jgi:hypothetical protein
LGSLPEDEPITSEWGFEECFLSTANPEVCLRAEESSYLVPVPEFYKHAYFLSIDTQNRKDHKEDPGWPRFTVHENFHLTGAAYQQILAKAHCRVLEARVRCAELEQTFALSQTTPPSVLRFWVDNFVYQDNGRPFLSLLQVQLRDRNLAKQLVVPGWFGKEVSEDPDYTRRAIWERLVSGGLAFYEEREAV